MKGIKWEGTGRQLESSHYEWKFTVTSQPWGWNAGTMDNLVVEPKKQPLPKNARAIIVQDNGHSHEFPSIAAAANFIGVKSKTLGMGLLRKPIYKAMGYQVFYRREDGSDQRV